MPWARNGALGEKERISAWLALSLRQWPEAFPYCISKPVFGNERQLQESYNKICFFFPRVRIFFLFVCNDVQREVVKDHFQPMCSHSVYILYLLYVVIVV